MPLWKKAAFALTAALMALGLLEAAVRLALPPIQLRGPFEKPPEQVTDRDVSVFRSDPLLFWRLRENVRNEDWDFTQVTTNDWSLRYGAIRDKGVIAREQGRPVFRIVCVGDSVTFGYRVPEGGTFAAVLQQTLNAAFPSRYWEVIPLACPGYSSLQSLEHLRERIGQLNPDFLILNSGWNDIQITDYPDKLVFEESRAVRSLQGWLRHSQCYLRLRQWLLGARPAGEAPPPVRRSLTRRVSVGDYCANILRMAEMGRARQAPSLVLNLVFQRIEPGDPTTLAIPEYRAALAESCAAENIPHLSTPFLTEDAWPRNRGFFGEPVHPSDRGHYLIARRILAWMLETGALPLAEGDQPAANDLLEAYGKPGEMNFEAEMAQSFKPMPLDDLPPGPLTLPPPPRRGLRRYLFQDRYWQGPLLHAQPAPDIHHTLEEWRTLESRPLVPPFSLLWDGWLMIPETGEWGIGTSSDDGSFVYLDGELWLDNGGLHGPEIKMKSAPLGAGPHRLHVWYFDVGYGAEMRLMWTRPGSETPAVIPAEFFRRE